MILKEISDGISEPKNVIKKKKIISVDLQKAIHEVRSRETPSDKMIEEVGRFFYPMLKEKIEKNEMEYLGEGQEGKIFKIIMKLHDGKDVIFIVIKKRIDGKPEDEIKKQNEFYKISKKLKNGVKVPRIVEQPIVTNNGEKYMVMDYINGKTLYALVLEKIMEKLYNDNMNFKSYFERLKRFKGEEFLDKGDINKRSLFDFNTDADANECIYKTINFLVNNTTYINKYIEGASSNSAAGSYRLDKKGLDDVLRKIYYSFPKGIFTNEEIKELKKKLGDFFAACHKQSLYHRDIGGNSKNIMFELNEDLEIVPVIIDFGKAKIDFEGEAKEYGQGEGPYHEAGLEGEGSGYVPDTRIISIISDYNIIEKDETELWVEDLKSSKNTIYEKCLPKMDLIRGELRITKDINFHRKGKIQNIISNDKRNPGYYQIFLEYGGTKKKEQWCYMRPIYLVDYDKTTESIKDDLRMRETIFTEIISLTINDFKMIKDFFVQELKKNTKRQTYAKYFLEYIYKIENYLY